MCETFSSAPDIMKSVIGPIMAEMSFPNMIACCTELDGRRLDHRLRSQIRRWISDNCLQCEICDAP